jgi:HEAT repeat
MGLFDWLAGKRSAAKPQPSPRAEIADADFDRNLLYIEPQTAASSAPLIDSLTRRMTAAYRLARQSDGLWMGFHTCICGVNSSTRDYFLPTGEMTNSLCVHYLAHHREAIPSRQLERVANLRFGEDEPSEGELRGERWRGNWPVDYFGETRLVRFAEAGIDLASIYFAAVDHPHAGPLLEHHGLSNLRRCTEEVLPEFVHALRQSHGDVGSWVAQACWPANFRAAWVPPLLALLSHENSGVREWACSSLGTIADTRIARVSWIPDDTRKSIEPLPAEQAKTITRALLAVAAVRPRTWVEDAAVGALVQIGPLARWAITMLLDSLDSGPDEPTGTRFCDLLQLVGLQGQEAAEALIRITSALTDARLLRLVENALIDIGTETTLQALGMRWPLPDEAGRSLLATMLAHPDKAARVAARSTFQAINDQPDRAEMILQAGA